MKRFGRAWYHCRAIAGPPVKRPGNEHTFATAGCSGHWHRFRKCQADATPQRKPAASFATGANNSAPAFWRARGIAG